MESKKSSGSNGRTRNWTFVVYPESAPENWRDIIDEYHVEWVESPLHDKDVNGDGELKKPHIHVGMFFAGNKTFEQVEAITKSVNAPIPQRCHSMKALVRYFAHLDNPEKAQYSVEDIRGHGGVDVAEMLRPSSSERYTIIRDILAYIRENGITEFQDILDYASAEHFDDWFPLLCDNSAYVVGQYIKSCRYRYATCDRSDD